MPRITLPGDNWAELRTAEEMLEEDREKVIQAMAAAGDDLNMRTYQGRRQWIVNAVKNWSFEAPIPSSEPKSLSKLPMKTYQLLQKHVDKVLAELNEDLSEEVESPPVPSAS